MKAKIYENGKWELELFLDKEKVEDARIIINKLKGLQDDIESKFNK